MNILFNKEVMLVKFPIIFPLIYIFILYTFPSFETQLVFITILLLAETHFGATWPFFLNKVNLNYISQNKLSLVFTPLILTLFCVVGFFYFKNFFLLIFFAANVYHVTRQSFGIMNLYTKNIEEKKYYSNTIYIFNFIFFLIAFFRFYIPIIENNHLLLLNLLIIILMLISITPQIKKFGYSENTLTLITGVLIFYPVCFVSNPVHAIIMGVTMHYSQYLFLTSKVMNKRSKEDAAHKKNYLTSFWVVVGVYAIIMSVLSIFGKNDSEFLKNLIFIPITGQMLHFYLDSQLWKFSVEHNRNNILRHL
tara:strand:- start:697 stop:1617 length:921 start_codon:yes stop_codon:yes gene_type:complete